MITLEEMESMLDEAAGELPPDFYRELNGGIILLPEARMHAESRQNDLYIMGEYHYDSNMGRYIAIYYGSFCHVYGHLSREEIKRELIKTLRHEFRHHLESLGGERELEIEDERQIEEYKRSRRRKNKE